MRKLCRQHGGLRTIKPVASMGTGSALRDNESMNKFQIAFLSYTSKASFTKKASCAAARLTRATPSKHISGTSWLKPFGIPQSANSFATCPNIEPASIQKTLKVHPIHPKPSKIATQTKEDAPKTPQHVPRRPQEAPAGAQTPPGGPTSLQNGIKLGRTSLPKSILT